MKKQKEAMVTGASTRIGRAIAERLHHEGCLVVNLDRAEPVSKLECETFVKTDLSDLTATGQLLKELVKDFQFDALVNNVGTVRPAALEQVTIEDLNMVVALNLGVTSLVRSPSAPDIPTVSESGLPGFNVEAWFALYAPARTPPAIRSAVAAAIHDALQLPEVKSRFLELGVVPARSPYGAAPLHAG